MGLTFLAPALLAGTLAVVIPIVLHLTHRERADAVPFPSLMFLRRVPYRTVRRQRIRHWILLLVRTAIVLLLVAAFARPLVERAGLGAAVVGEGREVVILLDRSASMQLGDRWDRAVGEARAVVDGLGPDDRATIVLFSDRADAVTQATDDRALLSAALNDARPVATGTQYGPALQLARDILDASDRPQRQLVFLTDFQRTAWTADAQLHMPDGTSVSLLAPDRDAPANVAVTGVLLQRGTAQQLTAAARVARLSGDPDTDITATLVLGGTAVESRRVRVPLASAVTIDFAPAPAPNRAVRGEVRVDADALPVDDAFRFVAAPVEPLPILLLHHPSARAAELLYLRQALSIGSDPPFQLDVKPASALVESDLDGRAAVVLYDVPFPAGRGGRDLRTFVTEGGGVFVVLGPRIGERPWAAEAQGLLGAAPGPAVDRVGVRGGTLSILDYRHPAFAAVQSARGADFSTTRFLRYRRWTPPEGARVLARFDDGAPALAEVTAGSGRIMVWTAGAANIWSDLPLHPVFLPFVQEVVRHLVAYRPVPVAHTAGTVVDLSADLAARAWGPAASVFGSAPGQLVVDEPSGTRSVLDGDTGFRLELTDAGFYRIRAVNGDQTATIAVNTDPSESSLDRIDTDDVLAAIGPSGGGRTRTATLAAQLTPAEKERRQALWWYLMVSVAALALIETLLAARLSGGTVPGLRDSTP